jgi:hypothetical protein
MRYLIVLSILALISLSCANIPQLINPLRIEPGEVQFQDDFSDPTSGWVRRNEKQIGNLDFVNQGYQIYVKQNHTILWSGPGLKFRDVRIEVDATKIEGPDNNDFGIVCRARDQHNYYFLVISSDGYYGIGKVVEGEQQLIGMNDMPPNEYILQGQQTNHLRADCVGNNLSLYVNGFHLVTVQDTEFASGDSGLVAGTFEQPGTRIHFDNFSVLMP